jgi:cytidyltransferase-like protein
MNFQSKQKILIKVDEILSGEYTLGFGVFNAIHPGHIRYLENARSYGLKLIIAVSEYSDGKDGQNTESIYSVQQRAESIAELRIVDHVVIVRKNGLSDLVKKINPKYGAMLADFFRYCVLYNEGGIYLDIKSSLTTKLFGNIIKNDDICILDKQRSYMQNWRYELGYGTYEQWLLIFCKGHLYLKNMINLMVEALHSDIEPKPFNMTWFGFGPTSTKEKVLRLTGPDAFAVAIHKSIIFNGIMHREISYNSIATLNPGNINKKIYDKNHFIIYK